MKLNPLMAGFVFATMSFGAQAATIERTFDIKASDFFLVIWLEHAYPGRPGDVGFHAHLGSFGRQ